MRLSKGLRGKATSWICEVAYGFVRLLLGFVRLLNGFVSLHIGLSGCLMNLLDCIIAFEYFSMRNVLLKPDFDITF